MNSVIIIADKINISCPNFNANYNIQMGEFIGLESEETEYDTELNDSDKDGLPDIFETKLGTDIDDSDTDGDELTDYEEFFITGTDPTIYDSVHEGISDSDADCDEDGLCNIDEIARGTDPRDSDTDLDGLTDYDEIFIYNTDPLVADSDNDSIDDGSEVKLGLDPTNNSTHGVPDSEYSIDQTVSSDSSIFALINNEDSPYDLSVRIKTTGCAEDEMTVTESGYSHAIENEMIIGQCVDISLPDERTPETIQIRFNIKDDQIANKLNKYSDCDELFGIKRFNIFRFYDNVNMLLPVDTKFDLENNMVYADTTEAGTYCLVDMEEWFNELGIAPIRQRPQILASAPQTTYQKKRFNGHDYAKIESGIITWQNAKLNCEKMGGHLATITSEAEQQFIESLITDGKADNYWLGATDREKAADGAYEGNWTWITGEQWGYEHWGKKQPSNTTMYSTWVMSLS